MNEHDQLVAGLKGKEEELAISSNRLSKMLGIDQSNLSRVYSGEMGFSTKLLGAISLIFPDLDPLVNSYMKERARESIARFSEVA